LELDRRPKNTSEHGLADANVETVPDAPSECRLVILGASTGGPAALKTVLPKLPAELSVPVLVVQHMPPNFTRSLAERLNATCELEVVEATDQMPATGGKIIIAAGGKQLKLSARDDQLIVRITEDPPENGVRPSVDHLLRSAVELVRGDALAVIMTGMGRDGLEGCRLLKQAGGFVFAQSRSDSVVYGMPKAIVEARLADRTLPLGKIAPAIVRHVKRSRRSSEQNT
jgi:two-component system chemotaxis response regulator CheB